MGQEVKIKRRPLTPLSQDLTVHAFPLASVMASFCPFFPTRGQEGPIRAQNPAIACLTSSLLWKEGFCHAYRASQEPWEQLRGSLSQGKVAWVPGFICHWMSD